MKKLRVLFPFVEAGFGHIMPMRSIEETFRKKYGNKVEVVSSAFFQETGDRRLAAYEKTMSNYVRGSNHFPLYGTVTTALDYLLGPILSSLFIIRLIAPIAYRHGVKHMQELHADAVFSTHWATNYYAQHLQEKPLTVLYCPDAELNGLFSYPSDLTLVTTKAGYEKALRKKRFQSRNLRQVPLLIRNEAFRVETDKRKARKALGIPEDKFTVLLAEGGYGIGKMHRICKKLIKSQLPLTVVAVCGKNERLFEKLKRLMPSEAVTFVPCGFLENMLSYHAASDVFCGKSGTIPAEATFFGNPTVVTGCASVIEQKIARHYIKAVGSAIPAFSVKKAVRCIERFAAAPETMRPYQQAAIRYHSHFGSEEAADLLWQAICARYPDRITEGK